MKRLLIFTFILSVFFCSCEKKPAVDTVLSIKGENYSITDFFKKVQKEQFADLPEEHKINKINKYAEQLLFERAAVESKDIVEEVENSDNFKEMKTKTMIQTLYKRVVLDSIISEDILKELYKKQPQANKKTFEKEKDNLEKMAMRQHRQELVKMAQTSLQSFRENFNFKINSQAIKNLTEAFSKKQAEMKNKGPNPMSVLENIELTDTLATMTGKIFKLDYIINIIKKFGMRGAPRDFTDIQQVTSFLDGTIVNREILTAESYRRKIDQDEEFLKTLEKQKKQLILNAFRHNNITAKAKVNDEDIEKYYNKNLEKEFMDLPKSEVIEINIKDEDMAKIVLKEALQTEDFAALAEQKTERNISKKGKLGYINEKQYGKIGQVAKDMEAGAVYNELIEYGSGFSIIKVTDKKEAQPKSLKSVSRKIKRTLETEKMKDIENNFINELKRKYKVKIYWNTFNIDK